MAEAIAITSLAIQGTETVAKIVLFAIEVRHFKKTCEQLKNDSVLILEMMKRSGGARINERDARRIKDSLNLCLAFVTQCCQDWGILKISFEVAFRRKHEVVSRELEWCTELLIADTVTKLLAQQTEGHQDLVQRIDRVDSRLESEFRNMRKEVRRARDIVSSDIPQLAKFVTTYGEHDPRVHVQSLDNRSRGLWGQLDGFGDVECLPLVGEESTAGMQLPRLISIYGKISQRTAARRLHGVLNTRDGEFAIMESLTSAKNLDSSLASGEFCEIPLVKRLRFLYEICESVEYFHSIGILLKSLSSSLVFFRESSAHPCHIRPIITGLDNARMMTESSMEIEYDVRFEAPDFMIQGQRMHTPYTDVWSLAVLVRYCITGGLPMSSPFVNNAEAKKAIRQYLEQPSFLCESEHLDKLPCIKGILRRCFLAQGSLRPTVSEMGRAILNSLSDSTNHLHIPASEASPDNAADLLESKSAAMIKISAARSNPRRRRDKDDRLSMTDWQGFLSASYREIDAVSEYIVGAAAWLDLVEKDDCEEDFDATDNLSRARFALAHLTTAAEAGFMEGDLELAQVHKYLSRNYEQGYKQKLQLLKLDSGMSQD